MLIYIPEGKGPLTLQSLQNFTVFVLYLGILRKKVKFYLLLMQIIFQDKKTHENEKQDHHPNNVSAY